MEPGPQGLPNKKSSVSEMKIKEKIFIFCLAHPDGTPSWSCSLGLEFNLPLPHVAVRCNRNARVFSRGSGNDKGYHEANFLYDFLVLLFLVRQQPLNKSETDKK